MALGAELEDRIGRAFKDANYLTFVREHHCDIVALNLSSGLCYLVECKNYTLSPKQQRRAVRQLNRNYKCALELLAKKDLSPSCILKVLVAPEFTYQARGVLQYTPEEFISHILRGYN